MSWSVDQSKAHFLRPSLGGRKRAAQWGVYQAPYSWAERAYPRNLIHYNELDRGGHFAAWEQPDLFAPRCGTPSGHCASRV